MHSVVNYIVESSISLGAFTVFYLLVLKNSSQLGFKRWYLVFALVFSALLPLYHISINMGAEAKGEALPVAIVMLNTVTVTAEGLTKVAVPTVESNQWLSWVYWIGFAFILFRIAYGLVRISFMRRIFSSTKQDGFRLFITGGSYRPFSFFKWVFIPQTLWEGKSGKIILIHEQEHAGQYHSMDILILELVMVFQWFNPFVWVVRREMKDNHEYLADRSVVVGGISKADYFQSMLTQMVGVPMEVANNFSLSITKKRIKMLKNKTDKIGRKWLGAFTAILAVGLFVTFACERDVEEIALLDETATPEEEVMAFVKNGELLHVYGVDDSIQFTSDSIITYSIKDARLDYPNIEFPKDITHVTVLYGAQPEFNDEEEMFMVVEVMPSFPGGDYALMHYLSENVNYPEVAQEHGIQGRVYVSFVVTKEGDVANVQIGRGVDSALDAEALRAVKAMPRWNPGKQRGKSVNVKYMLPVNFVLQ